MLIESCLALFPVVLSILEVKEGGRVGREGREGGSKNLGRFPFKKKFRVEFGNSMCPLER